MFNHFREYTIHPVTGETATRPMQIIDPFESYVCKDSFISPNGDVVEYAFIDCYNIYYIPTDPLKRTAEIMPIIYLNGDREHPYSFGGFLSSESNGSISYPYAIQNMENDKYYVSRVCALNPTELKEELNRGNYILSNMPGAIWLRKDAYQEDDTTHEPTVIATIEGGYTFYSTIALSAYVKYLTRYYGTASYTPQGDKIPKYSIEVGREGIIQTKTATNWSDRQAYDCLNFADIDNAFNRIANKIPKYTAQGTLRSTLSQPIGSEGSSPFDVLIRSQLSSVAALESSGDGKIAQFYRDANDRLSINTNVSSADKVNTSVTINPDNGATSGTEGIEFDGSVAKILQITKNFVGLGEVENYSVRNLPLVTEQNTELFATFQTKVIDSTKTNNVVVVDAQGAISNSDVSITQLNELGDADPSTNYVLKSSMYGVANGVCPLDASAKIPLEHLPLQTTKLMGFFKVNEFTHHAYIEVPTTTTQYHAITPTGDENPSEEGWYIHNNSTNQYELTTDTSVVEGATYYEELEVPSTREVYLVDGSSEYSFDNGYCYIADSSVPDHSIIIGIDSQHPYKEFLVSSGDRLYALVTKTPGQPNFVDWSLYRDSDVVSSVCGKIGAVVLEPNDITFTEIDNTDPMNPTTTVSHLDNNWAKHTYTEVKNNIDAKLNHSMASGGAVNNNLVVVTDGRGEIVPGSVTTAELGLLSGHSTLGNNSLIDSNDTSSLGGSSTYSGKIVKLKETGFLDQSLLNPSMNIGMLVFEQAEYSISSGTFSMVIDNTDITAQTDGVPLLSTCHLFILPLDNKWTNIAMHSNNNGVNIGVDSSTHNIGITATVDLADTTQTETMPIAILFRRS